jgi:hypothetical protein
MARGDHIFVKRVIYTHHGIDVGDGTVIHFSGEPGSSKVTACVCRIGLDDFAAGGEIQLMLYAKPLPSDEIVARAVSRLGECGYNLFNNNCEHFARWCVTAKHSSAQVNGAFATGGVGATGAVAATSGVGVVTGIGTAAGLSGGAGVMSGLATVGGVVGGGAVTGLVVAGAAPGLVGVVIMNKALADDEHLPDDVREARRTGRLASVAGGAAGSVAGVAAVSSMGAVAGLSGAGITSGLAAVGTVFGGGMVAGTAAVIAAPAVAAAGVGFLAYKIARSLARSHQPPLDPGDSQPLPVV